MDVGAGQMVAVREGSRPDPKTKGGKSGLHRAGCWVTPRGGDPTESATETRPPWFVHGKGERVR